MAFTYDELSGLGQVFINGALVGSNDGPDNSPLTWPAGSLLVGDGMDGAGPFSTNSDPFFDELRIVNAALNPNQFLIGTEPLNFIPEPGTFSLAGLGVMAALAYRRRRRTAAETCGR